MNYREQNYLTKTFKLLANHNRIKILILISTSNERLTVTQLAKSLDAELRTISGHLVKLKDNNLIKAEQDGTNMYYSVKDRRVLDIIEYARKLA